ncbi:MAG: hypothetical protein R3B39_01205 [Candidatus Paceibacterota bacterium]
MARTYNRNKTKRQGNNILREQIASEQERQDAIDQEIEAHERDLAEMEEDEERRAWELEEIYNKYIGGVSTNESDVLKALKTRPCPACLCEHHPSAYCPADEDVHRFNESQLELEDFYHARDLWEEMMGRIP